MKLHQASFSLLLGIASDPGCAQSGEQWATLEVTDDSAPRSVASPHWASLPAHCVQVFRQPCTCFPAAPLPRECEHDLLLQPCEPSSRSFQISGLFTLFIFSIMKAIHAHRRKSDHHPERQKEVTLPCSFTRRIHPLYSVFYQSLLFFFPNHSC